MEPPQPPPPKSIAPTPTSLAPAPPTPAPLTSAPLTSAPLTSDPLTSDPLTSAPPTPAPLTSTLPIPAPLTPLALERPAPPVPIPDATALSPVSSPAPPVSSRLSYGAVADPSVSLYEMLHLAPHCSPDEVEAGLRAAQRWWNAQQANPKYRRQASEALARLREARELLLDPIRRQEYDRHHQQFRQSFRARRWQPVRDLIDVLVVDHNCTHEQHLLLQRFAAKRGLSPEETNDLLGEECLKHGLQLLPPPGPQPHPTSRRIGQHPRWMIATMGLSLLGLLTLPFYGLSHTSVLLSFPFFNNLRLLMRHITPSHTTHPVNGWDWLVGIAVLGGATFTALSDLQASPLLPLGICTAALTWLTWLGLFLTQDQGQTKPTSHHPD